MNDDLRPYARTPQRCTPRPVFLRRLNQNEERTKQNPRTMEWHTVNDFEPVAMEVDDPGADELSLLRDVLRLLPPGVTVQDAQGRMLMVNDAAVAQLGMADGAPT